MSVAAACKYMRQELGDAYDPSTYAWLTERHGTAGVPDEVVKGLVAARRLALTATPAAGGLRAVGGGQRLHQPPAMKLAPPGCTPTRPPPKTRNQPKPQRRKRCYYPSKP